MTSNTNTNTNIKKYSKKFDKVNHELRAHWQMGREAARNVGLKINELVWILHEEHPDWSINKIAHTIWAANEDLDGFSKRTIYYNLDETHKMLLDSSKQNRTKSENNDTGQSVATLQHNVLEQSSSTTTIPTEYEIKDADVDEDEEDRLS